MCVDTWREREKVVKCGSLKKFVSSVSVNKFDETRGDECELCFLISRNSLCCLSSIMASEVYSPTTAPNPKSSWCLVPSQHLDKVRFLIKVTEVMFSFVAFILEEVVSSCNSCFALYSFEFVSCTAFLFTLLLLVLLSTTLHTRVGITCWPSLVRAAPGLV
nr:PREDICTED: CKLF-like MARVEL transmembrane domain-containing protein 6 [Paralichthys olivaceus]